MRKQLISFAQVIKFSKILSSRGLTPTPPLAYALGLEGYGLDYITGNNTMVHFNSSYDSSRFVACCCLLLNADILGLAYSAA